jgi:hypothetical protein
MSLRSRIAIGFFFTLTQCRQDVSDARLAILPYQAARVSILFSACCDTGDNIGGISECGSGGGRIAAGSGGAPRSQA